MRQISERAKHGASLGAKAAADAVLLPGAGAAGGFIWRHRKAIVRSIVASMVVGALFVLLLFAVLTGAVPEGPTRANSAAADCTATATGAGGLASFGLDAQQETNAAIVVHEAEDVLHLPSQAAVIAIMTALQESSITNLPNVNVPGSYTDPNVQWGSYSPSNPPDNGTSVGLFQQQDNWGTVTRRMDIAESAATFFGAPSPPFPDAPPGLLQIPDWQAQPLGAVAQDIQGSAYPYAYAPWQSEATQIVAAVSGLSVQIGGACTTSYSLDGYENPLRAVHHLTPMRIDMGVDYAGSGTIYPIGDGTVTNLYNAGWPGGAFVCYQLTAGPAKGLYVYVAENVKPLVHIGQHVLPTTPLATLVDASPNLETGWAAAPGTGNSLADTMTTSTGQPVFNGSNSTAAGINFNELLVALGAPTGIYQTGKGPPGPALPPQQYPDWETLSDGTSSSTTSTTSTTTPKL